MPFAEGILPQTALECLRYYMLEYHVDGFIINPYHIPWEFVVNDPLLKGVKILQRNDEFQNVMRRFLKGDEGMIHDVIRALAFHANVDGCLNYMTAQTGFTLQDLVSYDEKHNEANGEQNQDGPDYNFSWNCGAEGPSRKKEIIRLRKNQVYNAFFLLLTAQGIPCILAGDEFGRTQKGNNNAYCQDNELSWLNWNFLKKERKLYQYVKEMIAFRKQHAVLHQAEVLKGLDYTGSGIPDVSYHGENPWQAPLEVSSRRLGVLYSGANANGQDCYIAYNMHWLNHSFALPTLPQKRRWHLAAETAQGCLEQRQLLENQKVLELPARSIAILIGSGG